MTKARNIADGVDTADIADGAITDAKISGMSSSKLTGALPAISGAALTGISAGLPGPRAEVFTSVGASTFTVPAGVTAVKVTVIGGGGGGGAARQRGAASGGSAGGAAIEWITGLTSGDTISVTVGSGGAGATTAVTSDNGGTSSFGAYCSATGGEGAPYAQNAAGWSNLPGLGSGGDINSYGGLGGIASYDETNSIRRSGQGGAPLGGNGLASSLYQRNVDASYSRNYSVLGGYAGGSTQQNDPGDNATGYGCGGGGATSTVADNTVQAGGNGYQGIVIVEY